MINCTLQHIASAAAHSHAAGQFSDPFDTVNVSDDSGASVVLFLPAGTGQSVAAAINAAVKPAIVEAAE